MAGRLKPGGGHIVASETSNHFANLPPLYTIQKRLCGPKRSCCFLAPYTQSNRTYSSAQDTHRYATLLCTQAGRVVSGWRCRRDARPVHVRKRRTAAFSSVDNAARQNEPPDQAISIRG